MIRLRSKNLVDYERMRAIDSGADISYIDNGWLVGRGSNYGKMIVDLSSYILEQNVKYYIVADVECVAVGLIRNFSSILLYEHINSIQGILIIGKPLTTMLVGESQRVVYECVLPKVPDQKRNKIDVYNSYNYLNPDNTGDSFKITNLCFFKEDYTIDYVPYWYEPSKIMTRTRNLFVPNYSHASLIKEDNGFVFSGWGSAINTHETCVKMFKPNKTYTLSFDLEFTETPPYTYATQQLGFNFYDSESKQVLANFTSYVQPTQIVVGNKIHILLTRTMPADLKNAVLLVYSGYCRNADENNKWYHVTSRFSNIMLTEGSQEVDYVPYMSEVKTLAWGVKDECKIVLDGSEPWAQYASGNWVGVHAVVKNNAPALRVSQYNNYWGYTAPGDAANYLSVARNEDYIIWTKGSPPYPSWETTNSDGKAIANIPQIKADLAKRNLVAYYDNTNSKPKTLAELLKIVRREVYNNFSATVDSDILTLTNSSVENNVLILPDGKTVTNNVLNL